MSNLTELRAIRASIMEDRGFTICEQGNQYIADLLGKSLLTVNGWFVKSQLTPISDNNLKLLRLLTER
jgi:hypothetical protein